MSQLSFFSAESVPPAVADLTGLLAAPGQVVRAGDAVDGTLMTIPTSKSFYANELAQRLPREGINTAAAHLLWKNIGLDGVFLESEFGHQSR